VTVHAFPAASPVAEADLIVWLTRAAPGDRFTYWRGYLARDTWPLLQRLPEAERRQLASIASLAWNLAERGWVHLVQQRHGDSDFSYLAVARPRPRRESALVIPAPIQEAA